MYCQQEGQRAYRWGLFVQLSVLQLFSRLLMSSANGRSSPHARESLKNRVLTFVLSSTPCQGDLTPGLTPGAIGIVCVETPPTSTPPHSTIGAIATPSQEWKTLLPAACEVHVRASLCRSLTSATWRLLTTHGEWLTGPTLISPTVRTLLGTFRIFHPPPSRSLSSFP